MCLRSRTMSIARPVLDANYLLIIAAPATMTKLMNTILNNFFWPKTMTMTIVYLYIAYRDNEHQRHRRNKKLTGIPISIALRWIN